MPRHLVPQRPVLARDLFTVLGMYWAQLECRVLNPGVLPVSARRSLRESIRLS